MEFILSISHIKYFHFTHTSSNLSIVFVTLSFIYYNFFSLDFWYFCYAFNLYSSVYLYSGFLTYFIISSFYFLNYSNLFISLSFTSFPFSIYLFIFAYTCLIPAFSLLIYSYYSVVYILYFGILLCKKNILKSLFNTKSYFLSLLNFIYFF